MLENITRIHIQNFVIEPITKRISTYVTPNQITYVAGLLGILILPAVAIHQIWLAIILLIFSGFCDILDGSIARYQNSSSNFGTVLDIMMDRLVEVSAIFAIYCVAPEQRGLLCMLMLGSIVLCITSFLIVGIFTPNDSEKSFHYSQGIMERAEAFIFFILILLLPQWFAYFASLFTALVLLTAIIRIVEFARFEHKIK